MKRNKGRKREEKGRVEEARELIRVIRDLEGRRGWFPERAERVKKAERGWGGKRERERERG